MTALVLTGSPSLGRVDWFPFLGKVLLPSPLVLLSLAAFLSLGLDLGLFCFSLAGGTQR
jgi:hypothetical protein